ncbi:hypothetical protein CAL25_20110 [Bordetella genomosp. 5]|uniref:PIN like domain-containing protein n=2 Tax=Bordetella genomosp. 5 TaxID=1395608 RepID=A0A261TBG1_9BORD|nr:hypothetical protein CAL25_20110 [Bordetella genomosp. 5]
MREYISNRDNKLGELIQKINDQSSGLKAEGAAIPAFLSGLPAAGELETIKKDLRAAAKSYREQVRTLVEQISAWRGDDPVTQQYFELFRGDVIVDLESERPILEAEWRLRHEKQIPPGYKDGKKPDAGIGDFLIWRAILQLGQKRRDLVFVSADEKGDWHVRCEGSGVYPRPELVDEYRRSSGGRKFEIARLTDVLRERNVPANVVQDVKAAEEEQILTPLTSVKWLKKPHSTDKINAILSYALNQYIDKSSKFEHDVYHAPILSSGSGFIGGIELSDGNVLNLGFSEHVDGSGVVAVIGAGVKRFIKNGPIPNGEPWSFPPNEHDPLSEGDVFVIYQDDLGAYMGRVLGIAYSSARDVVSSIRLRLKPVAAESEPIVIV